VKTHAAFCAPASLVRFSVCIRRAPMPTWARRPHSVPIVNPLVWHAAQASWQTPHWQPRGRAAGLRGAGSAAPDKAARAAQGGCWARACCPRAAMRGRAARGGPSTRPGCCSRTSTPGARRASGPAAGRSSGWAGARAAAAGSPSDGSLCMVPLPGMSSEASSHHVEAPLCVPVSTWKRRTESLQSAATSCFCTGPLRGWRPRRPLLHLLEIKRDMHQHTAERGTP